MQGQGKKYGQKHETKELVQFHNHLHASTMVEPPALVTQASRGVNGDGAKKYGLHDRL